MIDIKNKTMSNWNNSDIIKTTVNSSIYESQNSTLNYGGALHSGLDPITYRIISSWLACSVLILLCWRTDSHLVTGMYWLWPVHLQQASIVLLMFQQFIRAPHPVVQLRALPGLHHQSLLHRRVIRPRFLVAMFAGNVRVLERREGRGRAGRRGGGSRGRPAQLLQSVGH